MTTLNQEEKRDTELDNLNLIATLDNLVILHGYKRERVERYLKFYNIAGSYCKSHGYIKPDNLCPCTPHIATVEERQKDPYLSADSIIFN